MSFREMSLKVTLCASAMAVGVLMTASVFGDEGKSIDPKCVKTRAVFDIGSSSTKMKVFKIDICHQKIAQILYPVGKGEETNAKVKIGFKKDLQASVAPETRDPLIDDEDLPRFTDHTRLAAVKTFKQLIDLAKRFEPSDYIGVATEAFREAKNGAEFVDYVQSTLAQYASSGGKQVTFKILVPSQKQEALLEWMGATQDISQSVKIPASNLISFGIGGGSMQIGTQLEDGKFDAFQSQLASDDMYLRSKREVKGDNNNLMPVTRTQIDQMVALAIKDVNDHASAQMKDRVQSMGMETLGVGGVINGALKGILSCQGIEKKFFTVNDVQDTLYKLADKTKDDPIFCDKIDKEQADAVPANLALILGVMKSMGLDGNRIYYSKIDNTYAAPFLDGLAQKMVVRKWKPKPHTTQVASASNGAAATLAAPGEKAKVKIAEPKAEDLEPVAVNDDSMQTCLSYNGTPDRNHVCSLNTCMPTADFCTVRDAKKNTCEDTKGKIKLVYTGGVCQ